MENFNDYELLIDVDTGWFSRYIKHGAESSFREIRYRLSILESICPYITWVGYNISNTKHGFHFRIRIRSKKKIPVHGLNYLQLMLTDDFKRSIFNFNRLMHGVSWKNANILFEENEI